MADEGFFENLKQGDLAGLAGNVWEGARDEWLGVDDFSRFLRYASEGNFAKALKSLGAGVAELGGTALMVVPGGQVAALAAKGGKLGKAGKALKFFKPLTLKEQSAIRGARALGVKPQMFRGLDMVNPAIVNWSTQPGTKAAQKGFGKVLSNFRPQLVGMGPGGYAGSLARGVGQFTGVLPAEQGLLAKRAFAARQAGRPVSLGARAGELASGRLGAFATRTGIDTEIMNAALGGEMAATRATPSALDLYLSGQLSGDTMSRSASLADMIVAELLGGFSPQAAM